MTDEINFLDKPAAVRVYARDADDGIEYIAKGPERGKFQNLSITDMVQFVLDHYQPDRLTRDIGAEIKSLMSGDPEFSIYGHTMTKEEVTDGNFVDHRKEKIDKAEFWQEIKDDQEISGRICEIRVFHLGDHKLGGIENLAYSLKR